MIDDLVHQGISEPYRMFTSRAEYRLSLRADNADRRLTPIGYRLGLVGEERAAHFAAKSRAITDGERQLRSLVLSPNAAAKHGLCVKQDGTMRSALDLLRLPGIDVAILAKIWPELHKLRKDVVKQFEIEAQYAGYLSRQNADIKAFKGEEALGLPDDMAYDEIEGLSREVKTRLLESRPVTFGAAARLPGMTPAAMALLYRHARRAGS